MHIAENKKANSISEYIIHMYQTEDLIRSYQFSLNDLSEYVIKNIPGKETLRIEAKNWYKEIILQMQQEGLEEVGHLSDVDSLAKELSSLNMHLLKSDAAFRKIYDSAKLHILKNMELAKGQINDPIQICLNGIYGFLLLKMNGKRIDDTLMESINAFGDVLSYLSFKYHQRQTLSVN